MMKIAAAISVNKLMIWVLASVALSYSSLVAGAPSSNDRSTLKSTAKSDCFRLYQSREYDKAFEKCHQAADQGVVIAKFNLGVMYDQGLGTKQDAKKAFYWYRQAANDGDRDGQYNVAILYYQGVGIAKDIDAAMKYFALAADQGDRGAQINLALLHNVKNQFEQAYFWARMAEYNQVDQAALLVAQLKQHLSDDQMLRQEEKLKMKMDGTEVKPN